MAGKLFLAALGALLGRSKASKAPTRAPRARQETSRDEKETPGVDFGRHFGSKNDDCWRFVRLPSMCGMYRVFCLCSLLLFSFISALFGRARKRPKGQIRHTLHAKTCFFKVRARAGAAPRTTTDGPKRHQIKAQQSVNKHQTSLIFQPPGADLQKYLPKGPSGDLPGTPRRLQEAPRALQDGSKSRQERSKSRPGAAPERPWRPLGAGLGLRRPPEASRRPFCPPRRSILAPPGVHVGASGEQKKRQMFIVLFIIYMQH